LITADGWTHAAVCGAGGAVFGVTTGVIATYNGTGAAIAGTACAIFGLVTRIIAAHRRSDVEPTARRRSALLGLAAVARTIAGDGACIANASGSRADV
jgi:hypothetical protein